jgi:hypothetical protein
MLQDPLALKILDGEFGEGDGVTIDAQGGEIAFRKTGNAAARGNGGDEAVLH